MVRKIVNSWTLNCPTSPNLIFCFIRSDRCKICYGIILVGSSIPITRWDIMQIRPNSNLITYSNSKINNFFHFLSRDPLVVAILSLLILWLLFEVMKLCPETTLSLLWTILPTLDPCLLQVKQRWNCVHGSIFSCLQISQKSKQFFFS